MYLKKICHILAKSLFDAFGKLQNGEELNDAEAAILAAKQKAMDAVTAADVVVWAFPLWNLTIPAKLQTFFDYTYAAGFSFNYSPEGASYQLINGQENCNSFSSWGLLLNSRSCSNGNGCNLREKCSMWRIRYGTFR